MAWLTVTPRSGHSRRVARPAAMVGRVQSLLQYPDCRRRPVDRSTGCGGRSSAGSASAVGSAWSSASLTWLPGRTRTPGGHQQGRPQLLREKRHERRSFQRPFQRDGQASAASAVRGGRPSVAPDRYRTADGPKPARAAPAAVRRLSAALPHGRLIVRRVGSSVRPRRQPRSRPTGCSRCRVRGARFGRGGGPVGRGAPVAARARRSVGRLGTAAIAVLSAQRWYSHQLSSGGPMPPRSCRALPPSAGSLPRSWPNSTTSDKSSTSAASPKAPGPRLSPPNRPGRARVSPVAAPVGGGPRRRNTLEHHRKRLASISASKATGTQRQGRAAESRAYGRLWSSMARGVAVNMEE